MTRIDKTVYPHKLARLSDANGDLSKQWVVVYYAWSIRQEKLVRKRVVINGQTAADRQAEASIVIKEVNKILRTGGHIDDTPELVAEPAKSVDKVGSIVDSVRYFLDVKKNSIKANSLKTYRSSLKIFTTYLQQNRLEKTRLDQFTTQQAFRYMDHLQSELKLSNKSYNKHLGVLETLFNFYIQRKQLKENPFVDVKPLAERPGKHTAFTPDQVARIREVCTLSQDDQLWLFLNFIYFTLARPQSELRLLRVGDILDKTIRINAENAKNNRTAHVLIPPPLEKLIVQHKLRDYPPHCYVFSIDGKPGEKPVYEKYFYNQHRRILTMLKMTDKPYDLYGWKHTGVIALYNATKDVKLVQRQCRHSSLDQTDKYLRDLGLFLNEDQFKGLSGL